MAATEQGDPLDRGQCLFERVDGPAGTQVIGAVDDQHRNGEPAALGDQVVLVPRFLEFGVDRGAALVADPEPRCRHLPGTGQGVAVGELGRPLEHRQLAAFRFGPLACAQLEDPLPVLTLALRGGLLVRLMPRPAETDS